MNNYKKTLFFLSLANLLCLPLWKNYLYKHLEIDAFVMATDSEVFTVIFPALMLCTLIITVMLSTCYFLLRKFHIALPIKIIIYSILSILTINNIRLGMGLTRETIISHWSYSIVILLILIGWVSYIKVYTPSYFTDIKKGKKFLSNTVLSLSPFLFITFGQTLQLISNYCYVSSTLAPFHPLNTSSERSANRVIWVIFDELDIRPLFENRPASVQLPAFDRFHEESLYFTNAFAAGPHTAISIPAMTLGISNAVGKTVRADQKLYLTLKDGTEVCWNTEKNVFSKLINLGRNVALLGNSIPYREMISEQLNFCYVGQSLNATTSLLHQISIFLKLSLTQFPFFGSILDYINDPLEYTNDPLEYTNNPLFHLKTRWINTYKRLKEAAKIILVDKNYDLVFIHWNVPHYPVIYRGESDEFSRNPGGEYTDNLVLVDRTLEWMRNLLEENELWENTTLIITSDHQFRKFWPTHIYCPENDPMRKLITDNENRVPLMIKLPHEKVASDYLKPVCTSIIHDLVLTLLQDKIQTENDLISWIDDHLYRFQPCL